MKIDALESSSAQLAWLHQYNLLQLMALDGKVPRSALTRNRSREYLRSQKNNTLLLRHLMTQTGAVHHKEQILLMLPRANMERLLPLLNSEQLLFGVGFLSKGFLLAFLTKLPKHLLLKLFLTRLRLTKFLSMLPRSVLWQLFKHDKIQMHQLLKAMLHLPEDKLQQLFKALTGQDGAIFEKKELAQIMSGYKKRQLLEAFKKLDKKSMVTMLDYLVKQEPSILLGIPMFNIMALFEAYPKSAIVTLMSGLNKELLSMLNSCLSDKQLAMTLSFMGNDVFSNTMIGAFPETIIDFIQLQSSLVNLS